MSKDTENMELTKIREYINVDNFYISNHARIRMFEKNITTHEIKDIINKGEVIEYYPDDKPCPSVLLLGFVNNNPYHIVVAECNDHARIITIYIPNNKRWIDRRKRR